MNDSLDLLVLGNGFDIEAGLKSKFEQFMDKYIGCAVMDDYIKQLKSFNYLTNHSFSGNVVSIVKDFKENCFDVVKLKNVIVTILLQKKCTGDVTWSDVEQKLKEFLANFEDDYIHDKGLFSHQWLKFIIDRSEVSKSFPFSKWPRNDEEFFEMCFFSQFLKYSLEHTKVLLDGKETLRSEIYRFISREVHSFEQAFGAYISDQVIGSETYLQNSKKLLDTADCKI